MIQDPNAPLLSELRWFIRQRWLAGLIVTLGGLLSALWTGWTGNEYKIFAIGIAILFCNLIFSILFARFPQWLERLGVQRWVAWSQIFVDLIFLASLVALTNGIYSPVIGFFVLHMIFASILLQSTKFTPYIAWAMAVLLGSAALRITGQWPETTQASLIGAGWSSTLLMTVFFTTHITKNVRANHDRTRAVLEAAADGLLTIDYQGRVELANPAAMDMFGYTSAKFIGEPVSLLFPNACIQSNSNHDTPALESVPSGSYPINTLGRYGLRRDGTTFPVEVSISKMNLGANEAYTVVVRDISVRELNEVKLKELNQELERHQRQLIHNEKLIAVGRMAAGVAHEIANPLANIDGLIQLVERNPSRIGPKTSSQLREQVSRITQIVRQLNDYAHPEEPDRRVLSVDELVQSAIDMIRFDHRHRQVVVDKKSDNPCCNLHTSRQEIQQVLVNLLLNALDAVEDVDNHQVSISSKCLDDGFCSISVHDNGIGISKEHQQLIFEPFFTTKPLGKGTGLGLSISDNLTQRNGGWMEVQSKLGEGTTISIILPVADCSC
ncbi:MAG: PAS domain S-box protein [Phycisphaerales bacterium]|nr:PAS domain S-box protein [Phycisphaerales bacterium]